MDWLRLRCSPARVRMLDFCGWGHDKGRFLLGSPWPAARGHTDTASTWLEDLGDGKGQKHMLTQELREIFAVAQGR